MKRQPTVICLALLTATSAHAQTTTSVKSTREAYGARLDAKAQPNDVNTARVNNRVDSRIDNRLSLRLERYRVGQTADPTAGYRAPTDDGTRTAPIMPTTQPPDDDPQR